MEQVREYDQLLKEVPDKVVIEEARKRQKKLRTKYGRWGDLKVMRKCKGCHQVGSTRWLRAHKCVLKNWHKRY